MATVDAGGRDVWIGLIFPVEMTLGVADEEAVADAEDDVSGVSNVTGALDGTEGTGVESLALTMSPWPTEDDVVSVCWAAPRRCEVDAAIPATPMAPSAITAANAIRSERVRFFASGCASLFV